MRPDVILLQGKRATWDTTDTARPRQVDRIRVNYSHYSTSFVINLSGVQFVPSSRSRAGRRLFLTRASSGAILDSLLIYIDGGGSDGGRNRGGRHRCRHGRQPQQGRRRMWYRHHADRRCRRRHRRRLCARLRQRQRRDGHDWRPRNIPPHLLYEKPRRLAPTPPPFQTRSPFPNGAPLARPSGGRTANAGLTNPLPLPQRHSVTYHRHASGCAGTPTKLSGARPPSMSLRTVFAAADRRTF